jgi:hypothetical protein
MPRLNMNNSKLRQLIFSLMCYTTRGGAKVSFDHNLARNIEKLIIGEMPRAKIIAVVRTGIRKPRLLKPPST